MKLNIFFLKKLLFKIKKNYEKIKQFKYDCLSIYQLYKDIKLLF